MRSQAAVHVAAAAAKQDEYRRHINLFQDEQTGASTRHRGKGQTASRSWEGPAEGKITNATGSATKAQGTIMRMEALSP